MDLLFNRPAYRYLSPNRSFLLKIKSIAMEISENLCLKSCTLIQIQSFSYLLKVFAVCSCKTNHRLVHWRLI